MIVKKALLINIRDIQRLLDSVPNSEQFFKNDIIETSKILKQGLSLVAYEDNKLKGFILICSDNTIDTIVSVRAGVGSKMLSSLPKENYKVFIHLDNKSSIALFSKFNFVKKEIVNLEYGMRIKYECKNR